MDIHTNDSSKLLYEGKAKQVFSTSKKDVVLVQFKNYATAFNAKKKEYFEGKGQINCLISAYLFELLESKGISTHFRGLYSENSMAAAKLKIIPLEVVVRNIAEGSLCRETPIKKGSKITPALIDYYYKDDKLSDPLLTDQRIKILNIISASQQLEIENISREINTVLMNFFSNL